MQRDAGGDHRVDQGVDVDHAGLHRKQHPVDRQQLHEHGRVRHRVDLHLDLDLPFLFRQRIAFHLAWQLGHGGIEQHRR
jgi:hypothetical protein